MTIKRVIYLICGCIMLGLGALGAFLPVLPSVPFLLIAAYCFSRSSQKLNTWFTGTKLYQNNLESYVKRQGMTWQTKIRMMTVVTLLMLVAFIVMKKVIIGRILISVIWLLHMLYFSFKVKTIHKTQTAQQDGQIERRDSP